MTAPVLRPVDILAIVLLLLLTTGGYVAAVWWVLDLGTALGTWWVAMEAGWLS